MVTFKVLFCVFVLSGSQYFFTSALSGTMRRCFDCVSIKSCQSAIELTKMAVKENQESSSEKKQKLFNSVCGYDLNNPDTPKVCCSDFPMVNTTMRPPLEQKSAKSSLGDAIETHSNFGLLPSTCGRFDGRRIINGIEAKLYEFPWMALIAYNTSRGIQFYCGGSIINSRYILTAAHCAINPITGKLRKIIGARIGELDYSTNLDCQGSYSDMVCETKIQDIEVAEIIPHEKFFNDQTTADIALLRLGKPITMYKNAAPICLPVYSQLRSMNLTGLNGTVAGWGITENNTVSTKLMKVEVPITKGGACRSNNYMNQNSKKILCAGKVNKDACYGDSGGPLMIESDFNKSQRIVQYGVISRGPRTCGSEEPGVYTDVRKYMDWILDHIKE